MPVSITPERTARTQLGYQTFQCQGCKQTFSERTGRSLNYLTFPTDIVLQAMLWYRRDKLNLRDLAEMFLERGFTFTGETVGSGKLVSLPYGLTSCEPNAAADGPLLVR